MTDNVKIMTDAEEYSARGEIRTSVCSLVESLINSKRKNKPELSSILLEVRDSACKLDDEARVSLEVNKDAVPYLIGKIKSLYQPLEEAFASGSKTELKNAAEEMKYYLGLFDKAERLPLSAKEKSAVKEVVMQKSVQMVYDYIGETVKAVERYFKADAVRDALVTWQSELSGLENCEGVSAVKCLKQLAEIVGTLRESAVTGQGNSNRAKDAVAEGAKITEALYACQRKTEKNADVFTLNALKRATKPDDAFSVEVDFRDMLNAYEIARGQINDETQAMELSQKERLKRYDAELDELESEVDKAFDENNAEAAQELEGELRRVRAEKENASYDARNALRVKRNFRKLYDAVLDGATQSFEYVSPQEKLAYLQLLGEPDTLRRRMTDADDNTVQAFIILVNEQKKKAFEYSENIRAKLTGGARPVSVTDDVPLKKETTLNDYSDEMIERQLKRGKITVERLRNELPSDRLQKFIDRGLVPSAAQNGGEKETVTADSGAGDLIRSLTDDILNGGE